MMRLSNCVVVSPLYYSLLPPTVIQTRWVLALLGLTDTKNGTADRWMKKIVFVPLTWLDTPCTSIPMPFENSVAQVPLSGPRIIWVYPFVFPVAGSSTPWKATASSPTPSTIWLTYVCEPRGDLQGGFMVGVSTLSGGAGGGLGGKRGVTTGGTLGDAWGSALPCSVGSGVVAQVRLEGGLGVDVGAPVAAKMSANFRMASMVWDPKKAKSASGAGLRRALAWRLAESMAASAEDIMGMAPLCGGGFTGLDVHSSCVSGT